MLEIILSLLIFLIPISVIIINLILLFFFWNKNNYDDKYFKMNMFKKNIIEEHLKKIKSLNKKSTVIVKIMSFIINITATLFEFPENIIRLFYKFKDKRLLSCIEFSLFFKLVLSIILFYCIENNLFIASYFLWRVLDIIFNKLAIINGIEKHRIKKEKVSKNLLFYSFNSFLIAQAFNFAEIIFSFSYLFYFYKAFNLNNKIDTLYYFFISFITFNYPIELMNKCIIQIVLVVTSILTYLIFIILIFANIFNLKYKNWKDK